jgi:uncharacterized beta barrel domain-containing protein DUF5777
MKKSKLLVAFILVIGSPVLGQDNLMELVEKEGESEVQYVVAAFKGTHVINGHSTKTKNKGELDFLIYHRFGPVNSGIQELFGLDQANMRMGFEYGLTGWLDLGIGRSTYEKTYDGYVKWKFIRQKSGAEKFPVSMVWLSSVAIPTVEIIEDLSTVERMGFTNEILISRKFGQRLTLQLMPGMVHLNTVPEPEDNNDIFYLGGAFRYKISPGFALTGEYYYRFNPLSSVQTYDAIGIGVDIQTGGHVFQLHFTNAMPTFERGFVTSTLDNFWDGDIRFGFNISRTFQLANK